jgi:hypothetical protein
MKKTKTDLSQNDRRPGRTCDREPPNTRLECYHYTNLLGRNWSLSFTERKLELLKSRSMRGISASENLKKIKALHTEEYPRKSLSTFVWGKRDEKECIQNVDREISWSTSGNIIKYSRDGRYARYEEAFDCSNTANLDTLCPTSHCSLN